MDGDDVPRRDLGAAAPTAHGTFGYLRLWTFDVDHSEQFIEEVARVLRDLPRKGLIIDLRSNPGGVIDTAERLLQLFTRKPIQPIRFALRATPAMAALAEADGNGADLADWAGSVSTALELGEEFSQHLPDQRPGALQRSPRGPTAGRSSPWSTPTPSRAATSSPLASPTTASARSSRSARRPAPAGANVWTSDDIEYAYHAAQQPPAAAAAGRQLLGLRPAHGPVGALGRGSPSRTSACRGDERYDMTERDLLDGNEDLIDFCIGLLLAG